MGEPGGIGGVGGANFADGNMKAKIDSFFAAAFDIPKKELYTIEYRAGLNNRVSGTLRRYSYPEFRSLGRYKLPQLGFRMAIDSKGELLYVAAATAPNKARCPTRSSTAPRPRPTSRSTT